MKPKRTPTRKKAGGRGVNETNQGEGTVESHPADEPDATLQCEYVYDTESARWRAMRKQEQQG